METSPILRFSVPPVPYLLESGRVDYAPGDRHPDRQSIGVFDLIVVEEGMLYLGEDDLTWSLSPGQSLVLLPNRFHYSVKPVETRTVFSWVHFQAVGEWTRSDPGGEPAAPDYDAHWKQFGTSPHSLRIKQSWSFPDPEQAFHLLNRLHEAEQERPSLAFWARQQAFEELLRHLDLRQNDRDASPVLALAEQAEAYLKAHYPQPITSGMMAEALSFHYNYISRCMKQVYGQPPMEYLMNYRLEQAKLLLVKTEWPISEIAARVGFESLSYFTSCFSAKVGLAPTKYRSRYLR
ncbi:AraC family transcriptional regulator [Gorillibacterium sp. CAU 1737]|uniref:AraC family transcriptional regulator n=1 Tax=Gorillibacterium sp. CAU 1737 TaxID=3140362 RepID=UPI0032617C50